MKKVISLLITKTILLVIRKFLMSKSCLYIPN
jgi:hypothetical protein